jgi:hypothetical protein
MYSAELASAVETRREEQAKLNVLDHTQKEADPNNVLQFYATIGEEGGGVEESVQQRVTNRL